MARKVAAAAVKREPSPAPAPPQEAPLDQSESDDLVKEIAEGIRELNGQGIDLAPIMSTAIGMALPEREAEELRARFRRHARAEGTRARLSERWAEDKVGTTAEVVGYGVFAVAALEILGRVTGWDRLRVATKLVSALHSALTGEIVELPD